MANSSSLKQFAVRMRGQAAKIPDRADQITRQVALAADRTVVLATPVDTGRARANWQATLGAPAVGTVDSAPGKTASVGTTTSRNAGVIAGYTGGPNAAIFLTNNLPYIVPLNNGHSKQAPAGFVERAVDAVTRAAKRARLIV